MSTALARRGVHTRLATPRRSDHRGEHGALDGVELVTTSPRSWRLLGHWRERGETWDARALVRAATARGRVDWIWERHALFVDAGMRWARDAGVPRVVELDAPLSLERLNVRDRRYAERIERATLQSADRVLAVSRWLAEWAVAERGCDPDRVVHLPNGTDVLPGDRDRGRRALGLHGPIAVWLGSRKPWHGLERLPALVDALPDWTVLVAGSGPTPVPEHPRIRSIGRVEGTARDDLLAASDVGLSLTDPAVMPWVCPLKILDYRAAGLTVLATDAGDTATLVGDHGVVLSTWTASEAAEAAVALRDQPRTIEARTWAQVVDEGLRIVSATAGWGLGRPSS